MYLMAKRKDPAAVSLGRRGGKARLKKMTSEERAAVARAAAAARWEKLSPEGRTAAAKKGVKTREAKRAAGAKKTRTPSTGKPKPAQPEG